MREVVTEAVRTGQIGEAPVEPLTRMILAGVMAAAEYVAGAEQTQLGRGLKPGARWTCF